MWFSSLFYPFVTCISGIKPTGSWQMISLVDAYIQFASILLGFFHLCSSRIWPAVCQTMNLSPLSDQGAPQPPGFLLILPNICTPPLLPYHHGHTFCQVDYFSLFRVCRGRLRPCSLLVPTGCFHTNHFKIHIFEYICRLFILLLNTKPWYLCIMFLAL